MRTQNIKFLRADNGLLFMFRYGGGAIYAKTMHKNIPSQSVKVVDNVSPVFSVWNCDNMVYLICLASEGVTLCLYRDGQWISRPLSRKTDEDFSKMSFLSLGETLHLIYSVKQDDLHSLHIRSAKRDKWSQPVKIDDILPFSDTPFYIGREGKNTVRLYYRTSDKEIKFRNFSLEDGNLSQRFDLISANMPCTDVSVLTGKNESHILYLVKGPFSSQLIYKGIKGTSSTKAKIIWEGQLSGSCSLLKNDGRIYALIYDRTKCFAAFSDDNGNNFSVAKNLGIKTGDSCIKAEYTDFSDISFHADEVPTDISDFSFPVTEDIFPSFIPYQNENTVIRQTAVNTVNMSSTPNMANIAGVANPAVRTSSEGKINELNERISELNSLLTKRNDEIAAISSSWKMKYDALLKENTALKAKISAADDVNRSDKFSSEKLTLSASDADNSESDDDL